MSKPWLSSPWNSHAQSPHAMTHYQHSSPAQSGHPTSTATSVSDYPPIPLEIWTRLRGKIGIPDERQQQALFCLKDVPNHIVLCWLEGMRLGCEAGSVGSAAAISTWPSSVQPDVGRHLGSQQSSNDVHLLSLLQTSPIAREKSIWFCTICDHGPFKGKHQWKAHERKYHFASKEYYCGICENSNAVSTSKIPFPLGESTPNQTWRTKERLATHLKNTHKPSSDLSDIDSWYHRLPEQATGCGFCVQSFQNINERMLHVANHIEKGATKAQWDHSRVILSLLSQRHISSAWDRLISTFYPSLESQITWPPSAVPPLEKLLSRKDNEETSSEEMASRAWHLSDQAKDYHQSVAFATPFS